MGAQYLETLIKTQSKNKFEKMVKSLWDSERAYYGTNPYSGSWATCEFPNIVKDPFPDRKWTKKKYYDVREWMIDKIDKRDSIAIKSPKGYIVGGLAAT